MPDLEQRAIEILNRRRRPQRPGIEPVKGFPSLGRMPIINGEFDLKGMPSILGMRQWLNELGYSVLVGPYPCVSWC
jgi:folylpolyglutamate synthase